MERHILLVQTNPVAGREDEFNEWYTKEHVPDILGIDGWTAAQRFKLGAAQRPGSDPYPYRYLAIYEMEGDAKANLDRLVATVPSLHISSVLAEQRMAHVFSPIAGRITRDTAGSA